MSEQYIWKWFSEDTGYKLCGKKVAVILCLLTSSVPAENGLLRLFVGQTSGVCVFTPPLPWDGGTA